MSATSEPGSGVRETLQRLSEPLKSELAEIDRQITKLTVELSGLRETQRNVKFVLARLDPSPVEKKVKRRGRPPGSSDRNAEVLAFLQSHNGVLGDDFGYTAVYKAMRAEEIPIAKETVRKAFSELHDQGLLRMTRTTMGGGRAYALVGHA